MLISETAYFWRCPPLPAWCSTAGLSSSFRSFAQHRFASCTDRTGLSLATPVASPMANLRRVTLNIGADQSYSRNLAFYAAATLEHGPTDSTRLLDQPFPIHNSQCAMDTPLRLDAPVSRYPRPPHHKIRRTISQKNPTA